MGDNIDWGRRRGRTLSVSVSVSVPTGPLFGRMTGLRNGSEFL